ncbi:MAG TPA: amidohydrolase family protein [Planctomycetota bacterium]
MIALHLLILTTINLPGMFVPGTNIPGRFVVALQADEAPTLLKDARVVTGLGPELEKASVLVERGKITRVAASIEAPANARVVDLAGKVLMPGLVDAGSRLAEAQNEEGREVTPALSALDAFEPGAPVLRRAALGGLTTAYLGPGNRNVVGGVGAVVKTGGPDRFRPLRERADLKAALGAEPSAGNYPPRGGPATFFARRPTTRMGVVWEFRKAFVDAREGRCAGAEAEILGAALAGKLTVRVAAAAATDLETALALAADFGLALVVEDGREAWKRADVLAARKVPVVLRSTLDLDPAGVDARPDALARLRAAGVDTALASPGGDAESLLAAAAFAVKHGASRADAFRAITSAPARILGVADRVGAIEDGRDADLAVYSGDPLDARSAVERVMVGGRFLSGGK